VQGQGTISGDRYYLYAGSLTGLPPGGFYVTRALERGISKAWFPDVEHREYVDA